VLNPPAFLWQAGFLLPDAKHYRCYSADCLAKGQGAAIGKAEIVAQILPENHRR
jgi:hypothetical protein